MFMTLDSEEEPFLACSWPTSVAGNYYYPKPRQLNKLPLVETPKRPINPQETRHGTKSIVHPGLAVQETRPC